MSQHALMGVLRFCSIRVFEQAPPVCSNLHSDFASNAGDDEVWHDRVSSKKVGNPETPTPILRTLLSSAYAFLIHWQIRADTNQQSCSTAACIQLHTDFKQGAPC